jgi:hypothetical protein
MVRQAMRFGYENGYEYKEDGRITPARIQAGIEGKSASDRD